MFYVYPAEEMAARPALRPFGETRSILWIRFAIVRPFAEEGLHGGRIPATPFPAHARLPVISTGRSPPPVELQPLLSTESWERCPCSGSHAPWIALRYFLARYAARTGRRLAHTDGRATR